MSEADFDGWVPKFCTGSKSELRGFIKQCKEYYVYVLCRPDGQPFYVGKGKGARVFNHETEAVHGPKYSTNPFKTNVIRKILKTGGKIGYAIDSDFGDETLAYEREAQLIASWGRLHEGGGLTNLAPGDGSRAGSAPYSKEKHQASLGGIPKDDPERAIINRFLLSLGTPRSICVKVLGRATRPKPSGPYPNKSMKPTERQALALVASAIANGIEVKDGAVVPRRFSYEGVTGFIENGVSNDITTSGLAKLLTSENPLDEAFLLNRSSVDFIYSSIGMEKLDKYGI